MERNYHERIGDIIHPKAEWKRIPTERFRITAQSIMDRLTDVLSAKDIEWLDIHLFTIPDYEFFNPIIIILGYACLDNQRQLSTTRFKEIEKVWKKNQSWIKPISLADIIRYGRRWEQWFRDSLFAS
jgi:hypothetical protein